MRLVVQSVNDRIADESPLHIFCSREQARPTLEALREQGHLAQLIEMIHGVRIEVKRC